LATTAEIAGLPASFFDENDASDFDALIQGFAHVVNREGCGGNGDQGFHLHTGLSGRRHRRLKLNAILA
jgi:hypothetical protein